MKKLLHKCTCTVLKISHFQYFPALPIVFKTRLALEVNWCLPSSAQVSIMIIKTFFHLKFFLLNFITTYARIN